MSDEAQPAARPATFREVFGQREFRALFNAAVLSWIGDYMAKAAVTVMVYQETESVGMSAAAFAVSYLPWLVGGPLLATVAERSSYRRVMIACDLVRMVLIALVAVPGLPVWVMLLLLFATTLANPPSQAAKSALMPIILTGDRLVVGLSVNTSAGQAAQVAGYVAGAGVAAVSPRLALFIDAATFAVSAAIIRFGVRERPPAMAREHRTHLLRETGEGFRFVFGTPVLRATAVLVFTAMLFAIVPEGLAAAWAAEHAGDEAERGLAQALIMAASPVGFILGGLIIGRTVRPDVRRTLIRPFAVLAPLALVPALLDPPPAVVAALAAICGFAVAGLMPVANGLFVQALPHGYRARAFGVMATGTQVMQGAAVLATGLLADRFSIPTVVGVWSVAGVLTMLVTAAQWPSAERFNAAIAEASRRGAPSVPSQPTPGATAAGTAAATTNSGATTDPAATAAPSAPAGAATPDSPAHRSAPPAGLNAL
ncbi:MFS-type transporter involved in bile tolerance, Atg22 family [Micromonospora pattaloongensis]|uniref:MFS-type transporter involved in bile tolerance, Atg22 family n=1 Tax=Micromonospora pattaloongensis TaxID=405436 RepID=A0A1H3SWI3_9ACTN|nr:MFS-type transporter involved in bile tolerance, Atg22 family [Micromonospora pattaloongensis]